MKLTVQMSKFVKSHSTSKNVQNNAAVVVPPASKQPRLTPDVSGVKTRPTSMPSDSADLTHPQKKATPPLPPAPATETKGDEGTAAATTTTTRAPRDPHGHKLIKVNDVFEAAHKTKYIPLGDGQYTYALYLQPFAMVECGKNWCEMEMLELVNGSETVKSKRIYTIDAEDLLKMCYLHAMANLDLKAEPRLHFEQWVLSVFQKYCDSYGNADYTDRGSIARHYMEEIGYSFQIGEGKGPREPSRLEIFFQKRCVRDLSSTDARVITTPSTDNLNIVHGKSTKSKFEYQIEGYIMCTPEGAGTKQYREEREKKEQPEEEMADATAEDLEI